MEPEFEGVMCSVNRLLELVERKKVTLAEMKARLAAIHVRDDINCFRRRIMFEGEIARLEEFTRRSEKEANEALNYLGEILQTILDEFEV